MKYLLTPPNTHFDDGLGVTACQFSQAADTLSENEPATVGVLPKAYLLRHALELWLKSLIVIIHKKFNVPYGDGFSQNKPALRVNGKWKPLSNTHNLNFLFIYFIEIYEENKPKIPKEINWEIPSDIEKKIKLVSGSDPKSTYFRYPVSSNAPQDAKKSTVQKETFESMTKSGKAFKAFVYVDNDYNVIESYNIGSSPLSNILKALKELNEFFNGVHAAFRAQLTNGN